MSQFVFGSGVLWARALTDASGAAVANPTPVRFGSIQDVSVDVSFDVKQLHGLNQFPLAIGRGKGKVSGKAKTANLNGMLLNSLLFGQTLTVGSSVNDYHDTTAGTAIPATPFTITVTPPNSGVYAKDLGVRNAATGLYMTRVASTPTAGQYSVTESTGAYVFSSADNVSGVKVQIDYQYTVASAGSSTKSTVLNLPMGYAPTFSVDLYMPFQGKSAILSFPMATASKLSMATKLDDFSIPEFDFECFADSGGNVMTWSWGE